MGMTTKPASLSIFMKWRKSFCHPSTSLISLPHVLPSTLESHRQEQYTALGHTTNMKKDHWAPAKQQPPSAQAGATFFPLQEPAPSHVHDHRQPKGQSFGNLHFLRGCTEGQWRVAPVLSSSAQAATTKYHRLGASTTDIHFLSVLVAGSPRSRCQLIRFLLKSHFLACRQLSSLCVLVGEKEKAPWCVSSHQDTDPIRSGLTQKFHLQMPPHHGFKTSTYK